MNASLDLQPSPAFTVRDAMRALRSKLFQQTGSMFPGAAAFYEAAVQAWSDEFNSYEALTGLRHYAAADCAWQRRTAYQQLAEILICAL